jgi:hypothetical protein
MVADGETITQYGFHSYFLERAITSILTQRDLTLFANDYSEMLLIDNPEVLEVLRYFYDMALDDTMYPYASSGWDPIINGQVATSLCAHEVLGFSFSSVSQYQSSINRYGIHLYFHSFDVSPQGDVDSFSEKL